MNNLYLEQAREKITNPRILVNVAAQRASELARRYRPLVEVPREDDHNYLNIALLEIAAGMLTVEYAEDYKA
ncbi:MAG: DNA-directed RNA polymerase subunit omega [Lentisphaeria bacterium]